MARLKGAAPKGKPSKAGPSADRHREVMAKRSREESASVKEIGPLPPVADPARRESCRPSLRLFCLTYCAPRFPLPFSPDHDRVIAKLETCVLAGGQFAMAMPRGSGKTTLTEAAILWAILYGYRRYVVPVGATGPHAANIVGSVKAEIETNPMLAADFPEACYPIARLEGIAHRCNGQLYQGERTHITWTAKELILPTIPGSKASGASTYDYSVIYHLKS